MKLAPEVCLMVGDSPADIMSGKQAGVKTVAVKWTHLDWLKLQEQEPDYVLQKMSDILKISVSELKSQIFLISEWNSSQIFESLLIRK